MFNKIKAIKDLRKQAKHMQSTLEDIVAIGEARGGAVKIALNGNQKLLRVEISDDLLTPAKKETLIEGLKEAFANGTKKLQKDVAGAMKEMGGLEALKNLGI